ncbi:hypothetical protein TEQG_02490 [Trichophyton equinum CBS 127.97]|uniref:Uncharacterized protein n=1 Tax=Trichophyton equinum (strain ATCC MYA-4606 / CBS 127.97) TaxID=559882 RepID=F2PNJ1_TRIEC|nr:hypothetical protein TEQG_02490 [Trichophyton equinum CBS 127.97]
MSKTNKVSLSHVLCYATYHEENSMARELVGHGASFRLVSHGTLLMKKFESRPFNEVSFILSHGASLQAIPGDLRAFLEGLLWHLGGTESLGEFRWLKRVRLVLSNIPFYQESGVINEIFEAWLRKGGNCEATKILQEYGASFDFLPGGIGGVLERWFREDGASYAVKDLLEYQGASFSWVPGGFENLFAETVIKCARSLRQYENFPELSDEKLVARALSGDLVILGDPGYTSWRDYLEA